MPAVRLSQAGRSDTIDQGNRILVENWLVNLSAITKSARRRHALRKGQRQRVPVVRARLPALLHV
jgi:hypothetical protein